MSVDVERRLATEQFSDWSDLELIHHRAASLLRSVATSTSTLTRLLDRVPKERSLWEKSESLALDDKLVLYEGLREQGYRLRLHVSTSQSREVPHDHRFPLTTLILSGGYVQRIYPTTEGMPSSTIIRYENPGSCYTLHEDTVHSNIAKPGTVLLILRGPTKKPKATGVDLASGARYEKLGADHEPPNVVLSHRMTVVRFAEVRKQLVELGISPWASSSVPTSGWLSSGAL